MHVDLQIKIQRQELEPRYAGSLRVSSNGLKVNKVFTFEFREELRYRIGDMKPEDYQQLILLRKDEEVFVRVEGVISERNCPKLTPEQHMILGLFLQLLDRARSKLSVEAGINTANPSYEALSRAARSVIETSVAFSVEVPSCETQRIIRQACT